MKGPEITKAMMEPDARCGHHGNLLHGKPCPDCFPELYEDAKAGQVDAIVINTRSGLMEKYEIANKLYQLELHDSIVINEMNIMRVPGGWIYDNWDIEKDQPKRGMFVPFDNEFQTTYQQDDPEFTF